MPVATIEEIQERVGTEIGMSDWILIDQNRIDAFAAITEDHQFIHVDPERAKQTPFRGTVNYGFEKVRFMAPVKSGKRVRGRFRMLSAEEKRASQWQITYEVTVEIEDEDKPALVADWIGYMFI